MKPHNSFLYITFYLTVDCQECGGNLTDTFGRIDFTSVSDAHNSLDCYWSIYGRYGNKTVIQLDIIYIDMNYHEDCSHDYLEVLICKHSMPDFSM